MTGTIFNEDLGDENTKLGVLAGLIRLLASDQYA